MGICKCRKKADLFCWHCQKTVCLDCITDEGHKLAYIGTYDDWLSHPNVPPAVCPLSMKILSEGDDVIRFMNLLFLVSAIDDYGKSKPANTALAGFTIPGTDEPMVPPPEEQSKLAQQIRQKLSKFPWIANIIALQSEIVPQTDKQPPTLPYSPFAALARPEGYALAMNINDKSDKTTSSEIDSNYTSDPLSTIPQASPLGIAPRKIGTNTVSGGFPTKKVPRPTSSEKSVEIDVHTSAKGIPYTPQRFREEDADLDKYKWRSIDMEALGFGGTTRTGVLAQRYQITGKRLFLIVALIVTLVVVFFLSMGIDEDMTVPLYSGLEEAVQVVKNNTLGQNITQNNT